MCGFTVPHLVREPRQGKVARRYSPSFQQFVGAFRPASSSLRKPRPESEDCFGGNRLLQNLQPTTLHAISTACHNVQQMYFTLYLPAASTSQHAMGSRVRMTRTQEATTQGRIGDDFDTQLTAGIQDAVRADLRSPRTEFDLKGSDLGNGARFSNFLGCGFAHADVLWKASVGSHLAHLKTEP